MLYLNKKKIFFISILFTFALLALIFLKKDLLNLSTVSNKFEKNFKDDFVLSEICIKTAYDRITCESKQTGDYYLDNSFCGEIYKVSFIGNDVHDLCRDINDLCLSYALYSADKITFKESSKIQKECRDKISLEQKKTSVNEYRRFILESVKNKGLNCLSFSKFGCKSGDKCVNSRCISSNHPNFNVVY